MRRSINFSKIHPEIREEVIRRFNIEMDNFCKNNSCKLIDVTFSEQINIKKRAYYWVRNVCHEITQRALRLYGIPGK